MSVVQSWQFFNPVRVFSGRGLTQSLQDFLPKESSILLLTSAGMVRRGTAQKIMQLCPQVQWLVRTIGPNPELNSLDEMHAELGSAAIQMIIAFGGGSVMDTAKALSLALCTSEKAPLNAWLREKKSLPNQNLPVVCLPTTAGTGAEVTSFATIWDGPERKKRSLNCDLLYPKLAILDVDLTLTLPWQETMFGALDTISHALETLWNSCATPVSQSLAIAALNHIVLGLPHIKNDLQNVSLRIHLQEASLLAGLAISQSKTAIAHSISYPLTTYYGVPHGLACGFTLVAILDKVRAAGFFNENFSNELLDQVKAILQSLNITKYLMNYCDIEQVLYLKDKMSDPTRMKNFLLNSNEEFIEEILKKSFI